MTVESVMAKKHGFHEHRDVSTSICKQLLYCMEVYNIFQMPWYHQLANLYKRGE